MLIFYQILHLISFITPNKDALFSYNGKFARAEFSRLALSNEQFFVEAKYFKIWN